MRFTAIAAAAPNASGWLKEVEYDYRPDFAHYFRIRFIERRSGFTPLDIKAMTTDLSNKSVEELIEYGFSNYNREYDSPPWVAAIRVLARRLEEAQQRNAAHDAKVAAEAKAEAKHAWEAGAKHEAMCRSEEIKALKAEIEAMRPLAEWARHHPQFPRQYPGAPSVRKQP